MKQIIIQVLLLALSGCSLRPDFVLPKTEAQRSWSIQSPDAEKVTVDWISRFESTELNRLIKQGLEHNQEIEAARARIEQSRASVKIASSGLFPSIDVSGSARRTNTRISSDSTRSDSLSAGASVAYELDVFGLNRSNVAASEAALLSTQYEKDALQLLVMGDTAIAYFTLLSAKERLAVADTNLESVGEILRIIEAQLNAGRVSALELSQQRSAYETAVAARASTQEQVKNAENALAVLLGQVPQSVEAGSEKLNSIRVPNINAGMPSELLQRRPDIASAEAGLIKANADIGAARAAFFPTVNLASGFDIAADPTTSIFSLAANISAPIFHGSAIKGGLDLATARQKELAANYRQTILVAFQEVENALAAVRSANSREQSLGVAQREAQQSYTLSQALYKAGSIDFQALLDTQRTFLNTQDSYVQAKRDRLATAVALFRALGGGWNAKTE